MTTGVPFIAACGSYLRMFLLSWGANSFYAKYVFFEMKLIEDKGNDMFRNSHEKKMRRTTSDYPGLPHILKKIRGRGMIEFTKCMG